MEHIREILNRPKNQESGLLNNEPETTISLPSVEERRRVWLNESGIPLRYRDKTLDGFIVSKGNKRAFDACCEYIENFPLRKVVNYKSLGLFSENTWGVGKTHLVCALGKMLIERCQFINPVLYMTEPMMLQRIRATYDHENGKETETGVLDILTNIPLLIIDDVGKQDIADPRFVQRVWFSVINARYGNLLPIVITANLSPDNIASHLGGSRNNEAAFDRLYEMLQGTFYEITGDSYRRKNGQHNG